MHAKSIVRAGVVVASFFAGLTSSAAQAQAVAPDTTTTTILLERDVNGGVGTAEQIVERRTQTSEGEQLVIEIYSRSIEAGRMALTRRIRRVTTATADGSSTVEDFEEVNPAAPSDPMRLAQRCVTTVRRIGPDSSVTERQVFERDVNGRLMPIRTEVQLASAK